MAQLHSTNFSFQKEDLNSIMLHLERSLIYLNRSKRGVQETTSIKCLRGDENWKKRQYKKMLSFICPDICKVIPSKLLTASMKKAT